nr:hypothetical protein [Tanacetum cinerariifolium]
MNINIDALYNILKQNQGDVNDTMGLKKKTTVVNSDPLALIAEKTKASKIKEKVVVSSDFEGSDADDFSELKKITAFLPTRNKSLSRRVTRKLKRKMMRKSETWAKSNVITARRKDISQKIARKTKSRIMSITRCRTLKINEMLRKKKVEIEAKRITEEEKATKDKEEEETE